jgi:hypothetical protein
MKIFGVVSGWFSSLYSRFESLEAKAAKAASQFFAEVNGMLPSAEQAVEWVGDVLAEIQKSQLPVDKILEDEITKVAPGLTANEIKDKAVRLASKDRADMLLGLAVMALQYSGYKSAKLRILRAAVEVAYGIYTAKKGI